MFGEVRVWMCREMSHRQLMGTFKLSETSPLPFIFVNRQQQASTGAKGNTERKLMMFPKFAVLKMLPLSIIGCLLRKLKVTNDDGLTSILSH